MASTAPTQNGNYIYQNLSVNQSTIYLWGVTLLKNRTANVITGTGSTSIVPTTETNKQLYIYVAADTSTNAIQYAVNELYRQEGTQADQVVSAVQLTLPFYNQPEDSE